VLRVFGQTSPVAFQNPSAPSAIASRGGTSSPASLARVDVKCPAWHLADHCHRRHVVILQSCRFGDGERTQQRNKRAERLSYLSKSFPRNFNGGMRKARLT
jgi:hypothetical protein